MRPEIIEALRRLSENPQAEMEAWGARLRFRRTLARLARDGDALVRDVGFDVRDVKAEIARPFYEPIALLHRGRRPPVASLGARRLGVNPEPAPRP